MPDANRLSFKTRGGRNIIVLIPSFNDALTMSHKKLIRVLRLCPASELFGALKSQLNKETLHYGEAIRMMKQLENKHLIVAQGVLDEVEELAAHFEESNNSVLIDVDSQRG